MASNQISPKQALAIYYLLFTGKEPLQSEIPIKLTPSERQALLDAGIIEKYPSPSGRGQRVRLTERAWEWAEENLGCPLSKSQHGCEALGSLLSKLSGFLRKSQLRLSDVLVPAKPQQPKPFDEIRSTYLKITDGKFDVLVRIAELGKALPHVSLEHLRNSLLELSAAKRLFFARLDDPQSLTEDDRHFTIDVGGDAKHLVAFLN